ncbi:MAG TPA: DUF5063 domain-containing protein [Bacteroidales bacterium]|nr:DUF5063 domain-containing protein [Bacteroidales bacterium]HPF03159.1 DUF5063 domain-containing protein [Bacteroidales bacterium]HPJ59479.1 DUF5063 domain-containing protein [Bacteroidales bacterium]HPR12862.1 DUF5063 domain-containing protein [Bacteroidales bacterium]HRW85111.1 DUF5063 domain-containing protein [Bacteroidales bacterium]
MDKNNDPVYSHNVVELVAVANEYCKYAEHASDIGGMEMLKIMQRLLPLLYLKTSLLPEMEPFFSDGNEKFVTENDWNNVYDTLRLKLGNANDFTSEMSDSLDDSGIPVPVTIAENMADIYQDLKDFLLLYQTGTSEVMNDAVWECRLNFETIWGKKLINTLNAIHAFLYSGQEIEEFSDETSTGTNEADTGDWIISKRFKDFSKDEEPI